MRQKKEKYDENIGRKITNTPPNPRFEVFTHPFADRAIPPDNARIEPRVRLDDGTPEQRSALDACAVLDHCVRSDCYIGPDAAVGADLGRGVLVAKQKCSETM